MAFRAFKLLFVFTLAGLVWLVSSSIWRRPAIDAAVDEERPVAAVAPPTLISSIPTEHEKHSKQPPSKPVVKRKVILENQPISIDGLGRGVLDWDVLASTRLDKSRRPTFLQSLKVLDGAPVTLTGFMSPLDEAGVAQRFLLLEFPPGCFFCFAPEPTGLGYVELASGNSEPFHTEPVKISGTLRLNIDDPEDFLYKIEGAELSPID